MKQRFDLKVPVIGILRGVAGEFFGKVMTASFEAGLQAIELTVNTENAFEIVADNRRRVPDGKLLGMGTIRNIEEARKAVDAGAMFMVTPNLDIAVIEYGVSNNIPVVAGALTPSEIYSAWRAGAAMVKVFPCQVMGGATYIKELRGPFDDISLAAVGGVTKENMEAYFAAGVQAVGVSTALFGREALREKRINELTNNVKDFMGSLSKLIK